MPTIETYSPGRGRPSKAYRYISALAGVKSQIKKDVKKDVIKDIKKMKGRPKAMTQSLTILGGKIRVKTAKSRTVKVGAKEFSV